MRLLITRAGPEGIRTAATLTALGHSVIACPVTSITSFDTAIPEGGFNAIIATSARGLRYAPKGLTLLQDVPLCLAGEATLREARSLGLAGTAITEPDAGTLLPAMIRFLRKPSRIVYFCGEDRKNGLEAGLAAHGHDIVPLVTYAARPLPSLPKEAAEALAKGQLDGVLHYSARSAALFVALVRQQALEEPTKRLIQLCISAEAAQPLAGWPDVRLAATPDETAMLAKLEPWA